MVAVVTSSSTIEESGVAGGLRVQVAEDHLRHERRPAVSDAKATG